jgi:hypothetical protein
MMPDYPDDADGDALRRVAADGNDMSAPMVVDFPVVLPAPTPAKHFAAVAAARGYQVQMWKHDDDSGWDVISRSAWWPCTRTSSASSRS